MNQSETAAEQELVIERVLDAPRERVWEAWTDPEQMKKWWGPKDFTAPTVEIDLKEGGIPRTACAARTDRSSGARASIARSS